MGIVEMIFYGVESSFWLKLLLFLAISGLLLFLLDAILRRVLKVKRKKLFSYNHVNTLHKKIDWTIRIIFIAAMIIGAFINISRHPLDPILFLEAYFLLFVLIFLTEIVTAIMEWKYAKNRNAYILTVSRLALIAIFLLLVYRTNFFGLFG